MKKIFSFLIIIAFFLTSCNHIQIQPSKKPQFQKKNIDSIVEYIKSPDTKLFLKLIDQNTLETVQLTVFSAENNAKHNNFLWDYTHHYLSLFKDGLLIKAKDYHESFSPDNSKSLVIFWLKDEDFDGIVDEWFRSFELVTEGGVFILPAYPRGFISDDWSIPPREIAQERFDKEIEHWVEVKGNEQWEIEIKEEY